MKSVAEVCEAYGITKKTLFYYDKIDLLKPTCRIGKQNHKMYDREALHRLDQIIAYQNTGLLLSEIKRILDDLECNSKEVMLLNIERLNQKKKEIDMKLKAANKLQQRNKE